ncbi:MAG TPA: Spy/CpxP family protein refolding chaperone [Alphaproteobacteria bacterium]|jgi:hypothetical protein
MSRSLARLAILPALFAAALALPAAAEDAHHPPADTAKPPATGPAQPRAGEPGMQGPGGMMMGNMMQMMHQMMSGMMQDQGAMHRMRMMGMGGTGMMAQMRDRMAGRAIDRVEGHIAFLKAELKIAPAQEKAWGDYAEALRANAKQLNALAAELAKAPAAATPVDRIAAEEKSLAARLEIARRTKPALAALYAALADDQKKTFGELSSPRRGMH